VQLSSNKLPIDLLERETYQITTLPLFFKRTRKWRKILWITFSFSSNSH
jgi:hypothetical protein